MPQPQPELHDSLEDIDRNETSASTTSSVASHPNAQLNANSVTPSTQPNQATITSVNSTGHRPPSHTGSNNGDGTGDCANQSLNAAARAGSSTDIMQNSGDRGDRRAPEAQEGRHSARPQQTHSRHAPSTSATSASREYFREPGRRPQAQEQRGVEKEVPNPPGASQSRSQGNGNEPNAASLQLSPPSSPPDQVTFSQTANQMHTNEQVLGQQL